MMKDTGTYVVPRQNIELSQEQDRATLLLRSYPTRGRQEPEVPGHLFSSPTGMVLNSDPAKRWLLGKRHPAVQPEDLPRTYMVERSNSHRLSSGPRVYTIGNVSGTCMYTQK